MQVTVTYPPFVQTSLFDGIRKRPNGNKINTDKLQIMDLMEGMPLMGKNET